MTVELHNCPVDQNEVDLLADLIKETIMGHFRPKLPAPHDEIGKQMLTALAALLIAEARVKDAAKASGFNLHVEITPLPVPVGSH